MSRTTGRPKSDNPKTEKFHIRVTPEEKKQIMAFSEEHRVGLLDLIRIGINTVKGKK